MSGTSPIDGRTAAALAGITCLLLGWGAFWGWQTIRGWEELQEHHLREVSYDPSLTWSDYAQTLPRATPSVDLSSE